MTFMKEKEKGMNFSIHAPYFINMGSLNTDVVERSKANMKQGIELAKAAGKYKGRKPIEVENFPEI